MPRGMDALPGTMEAKILADRETAYPLLMGRLLPAGVLGLVMMGLLGAFMSTVDTHLNWGMSYLVNDVYARFIRKKAGAREVVLVGRLGVMAMSLCAFAVAAQMSSIEWAWKFKHLPGRRSRPSGAPALAVVADERLDGDFRNAGRRRHGRLSPPGR